MSIKTVGIVILVVFLVAALVIARDDDINRWLKKKGLK